jgi:hypothetical protein
MARKPKETTPRPKQYPRNIGDAKPASKRNAEECCGKSRGARQLDRAGNRPVRHAQSDCFIAAKVCLFEAQMNRKPEFPWVKSSF